MSTTPSALLLRIARRVRELRGRCLVVKLGGSAMEEPAATRDMIAAVAALNALGVQLVVVHGGGKPIDRAMAAAGLVPVKVQGRRVTDDATLSIVVRVLCEIGTGLQKLFAAADVECAVNLAWDRFPLAGERLLLPGVDLQPVDLGRVGTITRVDAVQLRQQSATGAVALLPSLATAEDGGWLNVNADTTAATVAGALQSPACLFFTDTPGILRDRDDATSRCAKLTVTECEGLIRDGVIDGGMIPKVEACFEALAAGSESAMILDGRDPHALLNWFLGEPGGTEIVA